MREARTLVQLCAWLRGEPPAECDWTRVLELANRSLVTPQLAAAVEHAPERAPDDALGFLREVRARSRERNRRLWRQLNDATSALNGHGIEPTLIKGAAFLAASPEGPACDRLMSDIDLLVSPAEIPRALDALAGAGFAVLSERDGPSVHVAAELGRPQDPGVLDLHQRPPGPPGIADPGRAQARLRPLAIEGGRVHVFDAATQVLQLVLHDQFHDVGYWRGGFDLRHLADLARLAPQLDESDWRRLDEACRTDLVRAAMDAELLSAELLVGGQAGARRRAGALARWTHRRWLVQYACPALRAPLAAIAATLQWRMVRGHRCANAAGRERVLGQAARAPFDLAERMDRVRRVFHLEPGKI